MKRVKARIENSPDVFVTFLFGHAGTSEAEKQTGIVSVSISLYLLQKKTPASLQKLAGAGTQNGLPGKPDYSALAASRTKA